RVVSSLLRPYTTLFRALVLTESQVLRDAGREQEAFDVLGRAISERPDNPDLLYDQAMIAERLDRIDILETNLRKIIAIQPDHAQDRQSTRLNSSHVEIS